MVCIIVDRHHLFPDHVVGLIMFILWIVLMIKVYQGESYKLPIVGDIADNATK